MTVKVEVIPWETKAGKFGVSVQHGASESEAYFVGTRHEAEAEAKRLQGSVIIFPGSKERRTRSPR